MAQLSISQRLYYMSLNSFGWKRQPDCCTERVNVAYSFYPHKLGLCCLWSAVVNTQIPVYIIQPHFKNLNCLFKSRYFIHSLNGLFSWDILKKMYSYVWNFNPSTVDQKETTSVIWTHRNSFTLLTSINLHPISVTGQNRESHRMFDFYLSVYVHVNIHYECIMKCEAGHIRSMNNQNTYKK